MAPHINRQYISVSDPEDWEKFEEFIDWCHNIELANHSSSSLTEAAVRQYFAWKKITDKDCLDLHQNLKYLSSNWYQHADYLPDRPGTHTRC